MVAAVAQQPVSATPETKLSAVKLFAFGGVGFAGVRSEGEEEYREVLSRPNRLEILERVVENGTPEAKAYALVGIYNFNRDRFTSLASSLSSSKDQVHTARRCVLGSSTLGNIVHDIAAGTYAERL